MSNRDEQTGLPIGLVICREDIDAPCSETNFSDTVGFFSCSSLKLFENYQRYLGIETNAHQRTDIDGVVQL